MGNLLRLVIGVAGNAASLLLYASPILTFLRVIRKKNTEGFSCVPYIIALSNCLLYTWYGLPVVSCQWENFPVVTINGLGIVLEFSFILIYIWFSSTRVKLVSALMAIFIIFGVIAIISAFVIDDHHHRKIFVGSVGLVASVAMYGSPLVVVKQVLKTKSVEFMPFYLSLFSFLASSLWMAYGLLSHDFFLASPNLVGSPLGIIQLVLYYKYRKSRIMVEEEPKKWDLESEEDDKFKQLQPAMTNNAKGG